MKFYFISFVGRPIVEWSIFIMDNCMLFFLSVIDMVRVCHEGEYSCSVNSEQHIVLCAL